jgi:hypothetical protein
MPDRWNNQPVICRGGLRLDIERQVLGTQFPGAAIELFNYEPSVDGGYQRIKGYAKFSSTQVPGTGNILAVQPALGGVFVIRKTGTDNALYYGTGTSWGSILNTTARTGSPTKARIKSYNITEPAIVITDGVNPAGKYDGSNYVHLNGAGAPTAPKYATTFKNRLVLAPGSTSSSFVLSAPADDENFDGQDGAIEIRVDGTIRGLATFRGELYIFCSGSIHKLVGDTASNFQIQDITTDIGCVSHDTIQELGGDIIYLSPTGFRSLAKTERFNDLELGNVSSGIQSILTPKISLDEDDYSSVLIPDKNQYRCFFFDSNTPAEDTVNFLGKLTDTPIDPKGIYEWAKLQGMRVSAAGTCCVSNGAYFADADDGYVYKFEQGNSFDGTDIAYAWHSPYMTFGNATLRKVLQKVDVFTQVSGAMNAQLCVKYDFSASGVLQPPCVNLTTDAGVFTYGGSGSTYGTATYSSVTFPVFKENLIGSGFTAQFRISGEDSNPPHRIDTLDITIAQKARR